MHLSQRKLLPSCLASKTLLTGEVKSCKLWNLLLCLLIGIVSTGTGGLKSVTSSGILGKTSARTSGGPLCVRGWMSSSLIRISTGKFQIVLMKIALWLLTQMHLPINAGTNGALYNNSAGTRVIMRIHTIGPMTAIWSVPLKRHGLSGMVMNSWPQTLSESTTRSDQE